MKSGAHALRYPRFDRPKPNDDTLTNGNMHRTIQSPRLIIAILGLMAFAIHPALAQDSSHVTHGVARPRELLKQVVTGMPMDSTQEIRVITVWFQPGDRTLFHTHPRPVTVYVLEGTFTLEKEGQRPVIVRAGEAVIMPPNIRMTGYNRSARERSRVVVFYVSEPGAPFLNPIS